MTRSAHYIEKARLKDKIPVFLTLDMHVRNKKSGILSLYLLLCRFFFSCFAFSFPNLRQIRNREFLFHITVSLRLLFFCFSFFFAMRPSFTVVIRRCSVNCMQLPSPRLHLTCVLLYHIHVGETIYTALLRDDDDNDGATEEQQSRWNLGKVNREEWKILRSTTFSYAVRKLTHLGGGHRKIVQRHSEMAYINRRQREAAWNTVK